MIDVESTLVLLFLSGMHVFAWLVVLVVGVKYMVTLLSYPFLGGVSEVLLYIALGISLFLIVAGAAELTNLVGTQYFPAPQTQGSDNGKQASNHQGGYI